MSIRAASRQIDMSEQTLASVENGEGNPTLKTVQKICDFYEIPISEVLQE